MSENEKILKAVDQVGAEFLIREIFLGYKYRKDCGILYDTDSDIPEKLISLYYGLKPDDTTFDCMKKAFVRHYIRNESEIEGINDKSIHGEEEMKASIHNQEAAEYRKFYRDTLFNDVMPFWMRSDLIDRKYGGYISSVEKNKKSYASKNVSEKWKSLPRNSICWIY